MTIAGEKGIISRMRNQYYCYTLTKRVMKNARLHGCKSGEECSVFGKFVGIRDSTKMLEKANKINQKKRYNSKKSENLLIKMQNEFQFEDYTINKGYIEPFECPNEKRYLLGATDKGIELTNNLFLPFTPTGLMKEIYKDNKVLGRLFITAISSVVLSASGITLAHAISIVRKILLS